MKIELVSVFSTDKLLLPGLLYSSAKSTRKAAVWLHGMGDNGIFYNPDRLNALGDSLTTHNIALLAFNNRGAHNSKRLKIMDDALPERERKYQGGIHYERIIDCVQDIDGAAAFLQERGFSELYLIGHSSGANKICVYHAQARHNPFSKYVLAGPGDDVGLFFGSLGPKKFQQALRYSRDAIKHRKPLQIMPRYTGMHPFSAQSAYDILNPEGDYNTFPFYETTTKRLGKKPLFSEYKKLDRPTMVIFGENDEYAYTAGDTRHALELFRTHTNKAIMQQLTFTAIAGADHGFHGYEQEFADSVALWLAGEKE